MTKLERQIDAWASAELSRRSPLNRLTANIRRLIEYRWRGEAREPESRGAIYGQLGEALREFPLGKLDAVECGLDVGLLNTASAFPIEVMVGTTIDAYFNGAGSAIPYTGATGYLAGVSNPTSTACSGVYLQREFPASAPVTDESGIYDSHIYRISIDDLSDDVSTHYTGLLRLAVQSKCGAGRAVGDLTSGTLSGEADGLVRDSDYIYWLISLSASGGTATKLANSSLTECFRTALAAGLVVGAEEQMRWESWLLSDLSVDTGTSQLSLLTAAQLDAVHGGGRAPLAHGWHYARDGSEASIVTYRDGAAATVSDWYWEWTLASVTFGWDVLGQPTASVSVEEADVKCGWEYQPSKRLWYPTGDQGMCMLQPDQVVTVSEHGTDAPIYCYYDANGSRQVARRKEDETVPDGSYAYVPIDYCCPGTDTAYYTSYTGNVKLGGFSIGTVNFQTHSSTSAYRETYTVTVETEIEFVLFFTGTGGPVNVDEPCGYSQAEYNAWYDSQEEAIKDSYGCPYFTPGATAYTQQFCTQTYVYTDGTGADNGSAQFILIPRDDAEAVVIGMRDAFLWGSQYRETGHWYNPGRPDGLVECERKTTEIRGNIYGGDCDKTWIHWPCESPSSALRLKTVDTYSGSSENYIPIEINPFPGVPTLDSASTTPNVIEIDSETYCTYPQDELLVTTSVSAWATAYTTPITGCSSALDEFFSAAYDDGLIYAEDEGVPAITGGYRAPLTSSAARWAGWA